MAARSLNLSTQEEIPLRAGPEQENKSGPHSKQLNTWTFTYEVNGSDNYTFSVTRPVRFKLDPHVHFALNLEDVR